MITVEHLTKCYGDFTAVDDLSFEIDEGHVYGFLGPNGAGKSTTMNIMTGCLSATDGHVKIDGHDIFEEPKAAKRLIGYLPEQPPLYMNESPMEYLRFVGEAKGISGAELEAQIEEVVNQTRLGDVLYKRIGALSKGYRQRVGIAQALLGSPRVIILDEPTVGLDPIQIIEIRDLIRELGKTHTVIFSSHILSEVQSICDEILIIAKGKLIAFDQPENLEKRLLSPGEILLTADAKPKEIHDITAGISQITEISGEEKTGSYTTVRIKSDCKDIYQVSRAIYRAFAYWDRDILEMSLKKANLEDIFLELTDAPSSADDAPENKTPNDETSGSGASARKAKKNEASGSESSARKAKKNEASDSEGAKEKDSEKREVSDK